MLDRCPFCGGEAEECEGSLEGLYFVGCKKCSTITDYFDTPEEAEAAWNRRADGWIKCSEPEKLPPSEVVLIRLSNAKYPIVGYYSSNYECVMSISGGQYPLSLATHYCPLPQPPSDHIREVTEKESE